MAKRKENGGSITITTTISRILWDKAHNKIAWSEALRRGVTGILAEQGDEDYINPVQLQRKIAELSNKYETIFQENIKLQEAAAKARGVKYGTNPEQ